MNHTIRYRFITLCLGILIVLAAIPAAAFECTDPLGCVTIAPGEPVKLGGLTSLSGRYEPGGKNHARGAEMALNARGNQLLGHPVELRYEDSGCNFEVGANAALKLVVDPQLVGIIGPVCSEVGKAASPIISEAGLVMISTNNLAPELTSVAGKPGESWHPGYFRVSYNGAELGKADALFAFHELGVREVATLHDSGITANQGVVASFEQAFSDLGGEIVYSAQVTPGDENMVPVWTGITYSEPELLYFVLRATESFHFLQQKTQVDGTDTILLLGSNLLFRQGHIEKIGEHGVGLYLTPPTVFDTDVVKRLIADYEAAYGGPPWRPTFAWSYDAVNLLLQAIETVAVKENDGTLHIGRQALRDALYGTQGFEGVTGSLSCDQFGDCGYATFKVVHWEKAGMTFEEIGANVKYRYTPEH